MRWILILLITAFCSAQVTLTEEESKKIAINIQNLQVEVDSLKNIVSSQNKMIYIHRELIAKDSVTIVLQDEKINILENDKKLLEKKTKLVKPSWYENKWLYFTYGAILSYGLTDFIHSITSIL
jgi:adenylosuccinate lyase